MKKRILICVTALLMVGLVSIASANTPSTDYGFWLDGHYTSFTDNTKKVGEYNVGDNIGSQEFLLSIAQRNNNELYEIDLRLYDQENQFFRASAKSGNKLNASVQYRSLIHQFGQDMLSNLAAREYFPDNVPPAPAFGGKTLWHEIKDSGADYNYHRQEILTNISAMLSEKNKVRIYAAHRSIFKDGEKQGLSNSHCYSCHVVSETIDVKEQLHQINAGIEAGVSDHTVGYEFGYRMYKSSAADPETHYDLAAHPDPTKPDAVHQDFASRQLYSDEDLPYSTLPEQQKISNKVRVKGKLGKKTQYNTALGFNQTKNKGTEVTADAITGSVNLATLLAPRTRLVVKASGVKLAVDDYFVDLPDYRDSTITVADDVPSVDFDFMRMSTLNRMDIKGSAELTHRVNRRWTLSGLAGYRHVDREHYPEDNYVSSTITGQAKIRYRNGMKFSAWGKYHLDYTTDPFVSGRGLFEARGREALSDDATIPEWRRVFYYEREDLRYQPITTSPTMKHQIEFRGQYHPDNKVTLNAGVKLQMAKNGDLDSLDVKNSLIQPNLGLSLTPSPQFSLSAGYTMQLAKSRGPVTVALFDG